MKFILTYISTVRQEKMSFFAPSVPQGPKILKKPTLDLKKPTLDLKKPTKELESADEIIARICACFISMCPYFPFIGFFFDSSKIVKITSTSGVTTIVRQCETVTIYNNMGKVTVYYDITDGYGCDPDDIDYLRKLLTLLASVKCEDYYYLISHKDIRYVIKQLISTPIIYIAGVRYAPWVF